MLNAPPSLQVLSGAPANTVAQSESTLVSSRGVCEHLQVLDSTGEVAHSVREGCMLLSYRLTFLLICDSCTGSATLTAAPKHPSGDPMCFLSYRNHSHGSSVPVIWNPSYSQGWPECPPWIIYSPEIDASKFTLDILSDNIRVSQWLKYVLLMLGVLIWSPSLPIWQLYGYWRFQQHYSRMHHHLHWAPPGSPTDLGLSGHYLAYWQLQHSQLTKWLYRRLI